MEELQNIITKIEEHFSQTYRKVWIQKSSRTTSNDFIVTLFYSNMIGYKIVPLRDLQSVTYNEILLRLRRELNIVDIIS